MSLTVCVLILFDKLLPWRNVGAIMNPLLCLCCSVAQPLKKNPAKRRPLNLIWRISYKSFAWEMFSQVRRDMLCTMVFLGQKSTIGKRDALEMSCLQSFSLHPSFLSKHFSNPHFYKRVLLLPKYLDYWSYWKLGSRKWGHISSWRNLLDVFRP